LTAGLTADYRLRAEGCGLQTATRRRVVEKIGGLWLLGPPPGFVTPDVSRGADLFQNIFTERKIYSCEYTLIAPVALPE
jgi:hypothetical protein